MTRIEWNPADGIVGFELSVNAPVFEIDGEWYGTPQGTLPSIWITSRVVDESGALLGRTYCDLYCPEKDEGGWEALRLGGAYYEEGMTYTDASDLEVRIACFQAAEILYLHAAKAGNPFGSLCLGYVYSYDRCKGKYFVDHRFSETDEDYRRPYPREERAFECYQAAAREGIAEACYKLGDMYASGIGCQADAGEAYRWYVKAFELGQADPPHIWGSAALRLASAHEEGNGCKQSFEEASRWYSMAEAGLGAAVQGGDWFYERAYLRAKNGVKRMHQELGE